MQEKTTKGEFSPSMCRIAHTKGGGREKNKSRLNLKTTVFDSALLRRRRREGKRISILCGRNISVAISSLLSSSCVEKILYFPSISPIAVDSHKGTTCCDTLKPLIEGQTMPKWVHVELYKNIRAQASIKEELHLLRLSPSLIKNHRFPYVASIACALWMVDKKQERRTPNNLHTKRLQLIGTNILS